jgi:hypothetical protein
MDTVRDKLWIWAHPAGSYDGEWGLAENSRIGMAAAADYMGISNLIMVSYNGRPEPPYAEAAQEFAPLQRVVWSVVGAGGATRGFEAELQSVQDLAGEFPNFRGAMMDDFFRGPSDPEPAVYTPEQIAALRERLHATPARPLDLWVVLYDHNLDLPLGPHLAEVDTVAYWTWTGEGLAQQEANFARAEALAPAARKVLGCYLYDFGNNRPLPVELMQQQCERGLRWLEEGRIAGMIFLATCICDLGLEAVEWTRRWIAALD